MAIVTITGLVSAQVAAGEVVTVVITNPDGTIQAPITGLTAGDGSYSVTTAIDVAGDYTETTTIDVDAKYAAASSGPVPFTIPLIARTITSVVTVT
jgi:hypothetical protein